MTTNSSNSILGVFEDQIGVPPGTYPALASWRGAGVSGVEKEDFQLEALRAWLIAQGIPRDGEHSCGKSSAFTLRKAYQEPRYLNGWKKRLASGVGRDDSAGRARRDATTARRQATAAAAIFDEDLTDVEDDEEAREQNALLDIGDATKATATPGSITAATEQIAKAADLVISQRLTALQDTLRNYVKAEVAGTKLELNDDAKAALRALVATTTHEVVESLTPKRIEIFDPKTQTTRDLGAQHQCFKKLLRACQARLPNGFRPNVWLTGPAESGKTTAVENVAKALDLPFASDGSLDADYKVLGFKNAQGEFVSTEFLRVFEFGGIYCADEIDNWLPSALLSLNSALANGWISTSRGMIKRHENFVAIACANTWGLGATNDYVGCTKLDAASLDRFQPKIDWPIDESLEQSIASGLGGLDWCKIVQEVRRNARAQGLQIVISPRATYAGIALLSAGFEQREVIDMTFAAGLKPEQRKALDIDAIAARNRAPTPEALRSTSRDEFTPLPDVINYEFRSQVRDDTIVSAIKTLRNYIPPLGLAAAKDLTLAYRDGHITLHELVAKAHEGASA